MKQGTVREELRPLMDYVLLLDRLCREYGIIIDEDDQTKCLSSGSMVSRLEGD